jgi:hypothetical protein
MNSLERMMAAIKGEPLDRYPVVNPYPFWSMMPHWPEVMGVTFLHVSHGTDEERLACHRAVHEQLGIDWLPLYGGQCGQHERYRIENEAGDCPSRWQTSGFPLYLHDLQNGERSRYDEYYIDPPVEQRRYTTVKDVDAETPPPTADDLLSNGSFDMSRKVVSDFGETVFLFSGVGGAFSHCFRSLTFEGLYESLVDNPALVHAIAERYTAGIIEFARAAARVGIHAIRVNEYPCGAELLSDEDFMQFVFPYLKRMVDAFHAEGLLVILEYLGWVKPRLKHIAELQVDALQTESSLKGYCNDIAEYRTLLGDSICILGNSCIFDVIEKGDENTWRADAEQQSRATGAEGRFAICAGSPTTHATPPQRLLAWGRFMQEHIPPRTAMGEKDDEGI